MDRKMLDQIANDATLAGGFNLLLNPFVLLGVAPSAKAQEIKHAYEDALEDGIASAEVLQRAQQSLLNPRLRLDAELGGLLDVALPLARELVSKLRLGKGRSELTHILRQLHALPRSNVLAHLGSTLPVDDAELLELLELQATIAVGAVHDAVTDAREEAGSGRVDREAVEEALFRLQEWQAKSVIEALAGVQSFSRTFTQFVKCVLATGDSSLITKLDTFIRAYSRSASSELSQRRERVIAACDSIRNNPNNRAAIDQIAKALKDWNEVGYPLQLFESHLHREDALARDLYVQVRDLCLWLANEKEEYETARLITNACAEIFESLPRALGQMQEEGNLLAELQNQKAAVELLKPLIDAYEEAQKNLRRLDQDALRTGFSPQSRGLAKTLYDKFVETATATKGTEFADVPWRMVRDIAISINNELHSPRGALAIVNGLIGFLNQQRPSDEMMQALQQDKRAAQKNITQADLQTSIAANSLASAAIHIERLLTLETDPDELAALRKARDVIAEKRSWNRIKVGGLIAIAAAAAFIIFANGDNRSSSPSYRPPSQTPSWTPVPQAPTTPSRPSQSPNWSQPSQTPPISRPTSPLPDQTVTVPREDRPPVGTDLSFTQANIRYCAFQKVRLEAARLWTTDDSDELAFNLLVDDWNSRYSSYRYRPSDKNIVDLEVSTRRISLEAEGRSIANGWQPRRRAIPNPNFRLPAPPEQTAPDATTIVPKNDSDTPSGPPLALTPDIPNLLRVEDAIRVQKRLADLGYIRGSTDGTWGPASRAALRSFKIANNLPTDDLSDLQTSLQLFSASANQADTGTLDRPADPKVISSDYPPPPGAILNPLNRSEGLRIQRRLAELGYYLSNGDGIWGAASRAALRDFKVMNDLPNDEEWNANTERVLNGQILIRALESPIGKWSKDITWCQTRPPSASDMPISIGGRRLEGSTYFCDLKSFQRTGSTWTVDTMCTRGNLGGTIQMTVTGDRLSITNLSGSSLYIRCPRPSR